MSPNKPSAPPPRLTRQTLRTGLDTAAQADPDIAAALRHVGYPALRRRKAGFESLLRAIVGQQISIHAAAAVWARLQDAVDPLTPANFQATSDDALRAVGLSRQKILYGRHLASMILSKELRLSALPRLTDAEAVSTLTTIKGIGRWTAEIYLLFALGRRDIWPVDDLALVIGLQRIKRLPERPTRAEMLQLGVPWQPWRGAVAHLIWHYYTNAAEPSSADGT